MVSAVARTVAYSIVMLTTGPIWAKPTGREHLNSAAHDHPPYRHRHRQRRQVRRQPLHDALHLVDLLGLGGTVLLRPAIHLARGGIPTGVVSIPLRYMHSPVEMVQMDDVENTAKLIVAFAQKLSADLSFLR